MRKILLYMLMVLTPILASASNDFDKFDARLKTVLHNYNQGQIQLPKGSSLTQTIDDNYLNVFLIGDANIIEAEVKSSGGVVNTVAGNIITAKIPIDEIVNVSKSSAVQKINLSAPIKLHNNEAIKHVNADKVHSGASPLQMGYTGKNVIVGVMDSGIDWAHEDFRSLSDTTKSRILYIWDQGDSTGTKPDGFSYGSEWTKAQIEDELDGNPAGIVKHKDDDPYAGGHGTHTSGTAGGNKGIAPDADLIVVALDFAGGSTIVVDAANYIYKKAAELGKPAVINASIGSHAGPHDGTSAEAQGIDNLVNASAGRAFVASAGNEGDSYLHLGGFELQTTPNWTYYFGVPFFEARDSLLQMGTTIVINNDYLNTMSLAVGADSAGFNVNRFSSIKNIGTTDWKTIQELKDENPYRTEINYQDGSLAGIIEFVTGDLGNSSTEIFILITDIVKRNSGGVLESELDLWRLYFKGAGTFHAWFEGGITVPDPNQFGLEADDQYISPDNNYSVGFPAVGKKVIAVGAYNNRDSYVDVDGVTQQTGDKVGEFSVYSSRGPSRDGRTKPEIVAPGTNVISALSSSVATDYIVVTEGGKHQLASGTSMSSPAVAGAIALLLEKYPNYTVDQIRSVITKNVLEDNFTSSAGALPNNTWGYGKLDIFSSLSNQLAIESTGSAIPQSYTLGKNYPNPFNPTTKIDFSTPKDGVLKFTIHDLLGRVVYSENKELAAGNYSFRWDGINNYNQRVVSGIYFIQMDAEGFSQSRKMLFMK